MRFKYHWVDLAICSAHRSMAVTSPVLFCEILEAAGRRPIVTASSRGGQLPHGQCQWDCAKHYILSLQPGQVRAL